MSELIEIDPRLNQIEELLVSENMLLTKACERVGLSMREFYRIAKKMDDDKFRLLFARAREVRGLSILDDCYSAFEKLKDPLTDNKEAWRHKTVIDEGMKLAARYNQNLGERPLVQNNTQINNYGHDEFVMKKLESK